MSTQLTLPQVASMLNVSEKSIRRYIKAGRIKAVMIKGQKGNEYRIDKDQLKNLEKPPRGKRSHKNTTVKKSSPAKPKQAKKVIQKKEPWINPVREIAQERFEKIQRVVQAEDIIDYKLLYEKLLAKYEQSLMMIGNLEAQLKQANMAKNVSLDRVEGDLEKQEDMILELYQMIETYRKENEQR